jgi:excinuclease ABC subunit A
MADIEPYFCALFAREAIPVCPEHKVSAVRTDPLAAAERAASAHDGATAIVTYRVPAQGTEQYLEVRERLLADGYRRLYVRGEARDIDEVKPTEALSGGAQSGVEVVVDRVKVATRDRRRLGAAIEEAWRRADGAAALYLTNGSQQARLGVARGLACPTCARTFDAPRVGLFSYQSPTGACPECRGFGRTIGVDWGKVIPDESRSIKQGAIRPWSGASTTWERSSLLKFCDRKKIPIDVPWRDLTEAQRASILDGEGSWRGGKFPGVRMWFE